MGEKSPMGERRRRALADTAVAMRWAGDELTGHAWQVVERVFEHLGVPDAQERDARIDELFADMENGGFQPSEAMEPIALSQGKVALKEQRERHADLALRQAVAVKYEYQKGLSPLTAPGMGAFESSLQHAFQRMQSSLLEAQRHLAALDILKNLEGKHYSQRARKGGHTRARPASEQDQQALLAVMIKGMLYNDPGAIKRAQHNAEAVAHEWAVRIYELNRDFHILDIITRDKLEAEILQLLSTAEGSLLDDDALVNKLTDSRFTALYEAMGFTEGGTVNTNTIDPEWQQAMVDKYVEQIYTNEYADQNETLGTVLELRNKATLIVAKQRHGSTGNVPLHFEGEYTKFTSPAKRDYSDWGEG